MALNILLISLGCLFAGGLVLRFWKHLGHALGLGPFAARQRLSDNSTFQITQPRAPQAIRVGR